MVDGALTDSEVLRVLDELAEAGTMFVGFTGGEALVHPALDRFVARAFELGLVVRLKSNGTLYTSSRVARLVELGARFTDISLYGATATTHDEFTAVPGSFARTLAGIATARDGGLEPQVNFIVHRAAAEELGGMVDLARRLGVDAAYSCDITARHDGTTDSLQHRMTDEQFRRLLAGPHGEMFAHENRDGELRCACARAVVGIAYNGNVYPCIGAPVVSGNSL